MSDSPQRRALRNYRSRLSRQGLARFEVLGRAADRQLIRRLARQLSEDSTEAERLRAELQHGLLGNAPGVGGVLAALRRSPLVGVKLDLRRSDEPGRKLRL